MDDGGKAEFGAEILEKEEGITETVMMSDRPIMYCAFYSVCHI